MAQAWNAAISVPLYSHDEEYASGLLDAQEVLWPQQVRRLPDKFHSVSWILDQTEMELFRTLFNTTLNGGNDWFTATWLVYLDADADFARFSSEGYNATLIDDHWRISAKLELLVI